MTAFRTNVARAINMDAWGMADIFQVITQGDVDQSSSTEIDFSVGDKQLELRGAGFGGFNGAGAPTTGMITSIHFTDATHSVQIDCSISAALFTAYLDANSPTGLRNTLFKGADTVRGSDLADLLNGYDGDDVIQGGDGGDTLNGGAGNDVIYGAYDPSVIFVPISDDDIINGGDGNDQIFGGLGDDVIHGGRGADLIQGQGGADEVYGEEGDDFLYNTGAGPSDVLDGGSGTDTLGVLRGSLLGGQGTGYYASDFRAAALVSLERLVFGDAGGVTGNASTPKVALFDATQFGGGQLSSALQIVGVDAHSDIVWIYGAGGALDLSGFTFANWKGQYDPSALLQYNSFSLTIAAQGDLIVFQGAETAESVIGSSMNDRLLGLGGNDTLNGGAGNDVLSGGTGADALNGGDGSDWASYSGDGPVFASLALPGSNTGAAAGDTYVSIENLLGSQFGDTLSGDGQANFLIGLGGDDTLNGADGADILRGGDGGDALTGGDGEDGASYEGDSGGVHASLAAPGGNTGSAAGDSYISIENLIGSDFIDTLSGNALANRLWGRDGGDTLNGDLGDDVLNGGVGGDTLNGGGGSDWASYADALTGVIASLIAPNTNTGEAALDVYNSIENLRGSSFADTLTGNGFANVLSGSAGDDILDGGAGGDTLVGGTGDDTYYVDSINDTATEDVGAGFDTVIASRSWAVTSNIERVFLTGSGKFNVAGNGLANDLRGNSGDNWLNGSFGNDTLTGGAGRDSFIFNRALGPNNVDTITDYDAPRDVIRIDDAIFTGVGGPGALAANRFHAGAAAHDADDRIIYDRTTGKLFFDIDGTGAAAQIHFATLSTKPGGVDAGEFIII